MATFATGLMACMVQIGWFDEAWLATVPFGVARVELSLTQEGIVVALFAASKVAPRLVPRRRCSPRIATDLGDDGGYRSAPSATTVTLNADRLRAAEMARRDVGLAWSLVFSLAIAGVGFFTPGGGFHSPHHHPVEWWVFFAASALAVASQAPTRIAGKSRETSGGA